MNFAVLLVVIAAAFILGNVFFFYKVGPLAKDTPLVIPTGASLKRVTTILEGQGALSVAANFYWTARLSGSAAKIKAGEFLIPAGASQSDILNILISGEVIFHKITFPEGLTSAQVVEVLLQESMLTGEVETVPEEGTLLPETYLFTRGDSRADVLRRMAKNQTELLESLWADYDYSYVFTSLEDAVIIASIVEEETGVGAERSLIAAVFMNRLEKRMRLQTDPTVIYGLTGGEPLGRPILQSELDRDTPYNTYLHYGLPPGPITNPGRAALEAVFNPAVTDALYFVADGSGGHVFSETLEEHNENVQKWRKFQRQNSEN